MRVRRASPETLGAWECAMRAQWHLARMTREDVAEALRLAAQATALDPGTTRGLNIAAIAQLYAIAEGWMFVAGRYEEALNTAKTSLRENASVPGVYRVRAASLS